MADKGEPSPEKKAKHSKFKNAEEASDAIEEHIRNISYSFGSKMCRKGRGFRGTDHLEGFRSAYHTVSVEEEVDQIVEALEDVAELSIRSQSAKEMKCVSTNLPDIWNEFAESRCPEDKSCTLEEFDCQESMAGWELQTVRSAVLDCWDKVFTQLEERGHIGDEDLDWILQNDHLDTFVPSQIEKKSSPLGKKLAVQRRKALLTGDGADIRHFVAHVRSVPEMQRTEELRSLIMTAAPKFADSAESLIGREVILPGFNSNGEVPNGMNGVGKIIRMEGGGQKINESSRWAIEQRLPDSSSDCINFDEGHELETISVSFEQLLGFLHRPVSKDKFGFMRYLSKKQLRPEDLGAVEEYADLLWGKNSVADSATANYAANELDAWNGCNRLMRELYKSMAQNDNFSERSLKRAQHMLHLCIPSLTDTILELWDNVVLLQSRTGKERAYAKRVGKLALNLHKALNEGLIPKLPYWANPEDDCDINEHDLDRGEKMLNRIWHEVADPYFKKLEEDDDESSYESHSDSFSDMDLPKKRDSFGHDFCRRKEGNMDEDAMWSHFAEPIRSWFHIAGIAIQNFPSTVNFDSSENQSLSKKKRKLKPMTNTKEQIAARKLLFVTEWRDAVVKKLETCDIFDANGNNLRMTGKAMARATLALCAALTRCGICEPDEWVSLTAMFSALREGPQQLHDHFYGKQ